MNIAMQGAIHGRTVELEGPPGLDDGRVVHVILSTDLPIRPEGGIAPGPYRSAAGMMADYAEDDDAVLEDIYRDRKRDARGDLAPRAFCWTPTRARITCAGPRD
jgi:hypothetical protein